MFIIYLFLLINSVVVAELAHEKMTRMRNPSSKPDAKF